MFFLCFFGFFLGRFLLYIGEMKIILMRQPWTCPLTPFFFHFFFFAEEVINTDYNKNLAYRNS